MSPRPIHEGRNVKRIREILGIKQDALAFDLGLSQQAISQLEQKEALDKDILEKIAAVLKVPVEAIKNFDEQGVINVVGNTYNDSASSNVNYQPTFNPIDKVVELFEENKKLYEQLLQSEREKVEILKGVLATK